MQLKISSFNTLNLLAIQTTFNGHTFVTTKKTFGQQLNVFEQLSKCFWAKTFKNQLLN
jgi:hypothetical protein